jgi:hypothetical protein
LPINSAVQSAHIDLNEWEGGRLAQLIYMEFTAIFAARGQNYIPRMKLKNLQMQKKTNKIKMN